MSYYYVEGSDQRLPDKARLGQRTLATLAEIQAVERVSVDVLVAKTIDHYYRTVFTKNNNIGGNYGRKETEGIEQH